jgi:hypothetical protein
MTSHPPSRPYEESVFEQLRDDPAFARVYVDQILADGDLKELRLCLQRIAAVFIPIDSDA